MRIVGNPLGLQPPSHGLVTRLIVHTQQAFPSVERDTKLIRKLVVTLIPTIPTIAHIVPGKVGICLRLLTAFWCGKENFKSLSV